ncbi:hypothetical protein GOV07_04455, partial [Candidatus Woesearchaeota archaeon]|nr:hypothetical protein [Candidatus Woesearchaeota archaeon]
MPENTDEYELVSRNKIERLQHEVDKVRKNPFGDTSSSKDLLSAMDKLNKNMSKLVHIFETANDEIVRDYKDQANTTKINKVLEQNEKLAKGIVAIAELLKEQREVNGPPKPAPEQQPAELNQGVPPVQGIPQGTRTWEPGMSPPGPTPVQFSGQPQNQP